MKYHVLASDNQGANEFLADCDDKKIAILIAKLLSEHSSFEFNDGLALLANRGKPVKAEVCVITDEESGYDQIWPELKGEIDE